jgi:hypothetical protein
MGGRRPEVGRIRAGYGVPPPFARSRLSASLLVLLLRMAFSTSFRSLVMVVAISLVNVTFGNPTCAGAPIKYTATMNPWNAGRNTPISANAAGCTGTTGTSGTLPAHIVATGKSLVMFVNVTGSYTLCGSLCPSSPVGISTTAFSYSPLAGLSGFGPSPAFASPLVGVFLANKLAPTSTPASLKYTPNSFTTLSPVLGQIFPIGNGKSGSTVISYHVPVGATDLYVGVADALAFSGLPGCYHDNYGGGSFQYFSI